MPDYNNHNNKIYYPELSTFLEYNINCLRVYGITKNIIHWQYIYTLFSVIYSKYLFQLKGTITFIINYQWI